MNEAALPDSREKVFGELIDCHLPMMRRVVFRILSNTGDTDDVIQQALLKAWTKFDRCEKPDKISGWVCRIACNEAYDLLRRRKREVALFENQLDQEAPAPEHGREMTEVVEAAMNTLPDYLHSALNFTVFEGLSTDEAAALLGCGPATLYWRVHKARKILGKQLKELLK
jgi:RNA polymerase sigma-70 factor (ECF subfamily)